ncbi:hypothetical protein SEA_SONALI_25 [Arthrobacter phage Sonali]|uniref:Uncharacterized protein n=1 Tax=Arthrobacter phage Sonali TaxID=2510495 RepID=A0A411CQQ9_9CAUD|nr:hypothetical protein HOV09_gp25 [Arthrobacter phage Sonali]QAY16137.1 hypothetical protein SEA_SONALI_25 [Arthrobacter phage Sonali]
MTAVPGIAQFCTIYGRYGAAVGATFTPFGGSVTFTATVESLLIAGSTPPVTVLPEPVTAFLDQDGDLATIVGGVPVKGVLLLPNDDAATNPSTGWNYAVSFDLTDAAGRKVKRTGFSINAPKGASVDLTQVSQVSPGGAGTPITVGPPTVLTIGSVTTTPAGTQATATLTGAAPNQTLSLTIPRGTDVSTADALAFAIAL